MASNKAKHIKWSSRATERWEAVSVKTGTPYYGRMGYLPNGRWGFVKAGDVVDFVKKKVSYDFLERTNDICDMLFSMSTNFLKSYTSGKGANKMPEYTGNLIDSTSILIYAGGPRGSFLKYSVLPQPSVRAVKGQRWSSSTYPSGYTGPREDHSTAESAKKPSARGVYYRLAPSGGDLEVKNVLKGLPTPDFGSNYISAILCVGMPYAEYINDHGTKSKTNKHKGWLDAMIQDFTKYVQEVYVSGYLDPKRSVAELNISSNVLGKFGAGFIENAK